MNINKALPDDKKQACDGLKSEGVGQDLPDALEDSRVVGVVVNK